MTTRACHRYHRPVRSRRWCLLALVMPMIAACAESGASSAPTTSLPPAEVRAQDTTTLVATAPEPTGVPGLTATDPLCAAWAAYVGTVQALGIAASFGGLSSEQFAALELQASPRLVEVASAIDASLPPELA